MITVKTPAQPWEVPAAPNTSYAPTRPNGKRVPGWEDVNITALAADIRVSFRYLLAVLCGQRNCTLALLQQTAQALGISLVELIERMETAYRLRCLASAHPPDKGERRRLRSEARAMSTQ
jgi:hypothetical protein